MAIYSKLDDLLKHNLFQGKIKQGLEFLKDLSENDFADFEQGESKRMEIDGDEIFASLQKYKGKNPEEAMPEAHRKYIDLQYVLKGSELIRCIPLKDCVITVPYSEEKDICFLSGHPGTMLEMKPGRVVVLFPEDAHAPCIKTENTELIFKCVVKIAIED